ncbi:hypothetical protein [Cellulomonas bogoriensis]|nr:hypothetical protein [Cellulomonas bogoriensis]
MVLTDGTDVTFVSCQVCETRAWYRQAADGGWEGLPIETVLKSAERRRR